MVRTTCGLTGVVLATAGARATAACRAWDAVPEAERTAERGTAILADHGFTVGPSWTNSYGRRFITTNETSGAATFGHPLVTLSVAA